MSELVMAEVLLAAEQAMAAADTDPVRALPVAAEAARRAHRARHQVAASIAERAWGHALLHRGELPAAITHLRRSISCAKDAGSADLAAQAGLKLAFAVLQGGRPAAALAEIDAALPDLRGVSAGRGRAQRAIILHVIGRLDESLVEYEAALAVLRDGGDLLGVQRMLINRALVHSDRHAFGFAEQDLAEAEVLARRLGRELTIGLIANNLGLMETLRGDVPTALAHLDRAEQIIGTHGAQLGTLYQDRAELLLSVGLIPEARAAAEQAIVEYRHERRLVKVPEARLLLSRAASTAGDWAVALTEARLARRVFGRQHRPEWAALAQLTQLRAQLETGARPRVPATAVQAMVDTLSAAGWPGAALDARLVAAQLTPASELADGVQLADGTKFTDAGGFLGDAARVADGRGPAALRARGWYARALLRQGEDDRRGAQSAIRAGLRLLAEQNATMGAIDLRVHAATHRGQLAGLGLRIALDGGTPAGVLEWAERGRASQVLFRPVRPPSDPRLAHLLAELRAVTRELDLLPAGTRSSALNRQIVVLEGQVRDRARLGKGGFGATPDGPVSRAELAAALGRHALVEFVESDGELYGVTLTDGRARLHRLGPSRLVADLTERLPFALHRLARTGNRSTATAGAVQPASAVQSANAVQPAGQLRAAALTLLRRTAQRLDDVLFRPMTELADRPLVLVPTGPLHSLPWSLLPSCRARPVSVSPSATLWHAATQRPPDDGTHAETVVIAGPKLPGADGEAAQIAQIYRTTPISGRAATAEAVLAAFATARTVHLAAHGRLRSDNPMFSDVLLSDGPLVIYDLEALPRVPHTVVLAACESGRAVVRTGDELLGLGATLLARGAAELIASVVPVPDAETTPLMVAFHRRLAQGRPAAEALAQAQHELIDAHAGAAAETEDGGRALAAAAGFICLGSGI